MKVANKMGVVAEGRVIANIQIAANEGSLSRQIVEMGAGYMAAEAGQTAMMEWLKGRIDASFKEKGEAVPTKGTEYRKIVFSAYIAEGVFAKDVTLDKLLNKAVTEEEKRVGKFLKRVSDFIRNNYEPKKEKAPAVNGHSEGGEGNGEGEGMENAAEKTVAEKRIAALATVAALFEGNAEAMELIQKLQALA